MGASGKPVAERLLDAVVAVMVAHGAVGQRVTLAYSGGRDSTVLLHLLVRMRQSWMFDLSAVHVHHGLSPHADRWRDFCEHTCRTLGVPFSAHHVRIDPVDPAGIEAAARAARLKVFSGLDADWLLTAHHLQDQAETFLLQALRGAGTRGLAGMPVITAPGRARVRIMRPLLHIPPDMLDEAARDWRLDWIEDESNADPRFRRNALRHQVLPALETRFPGCTGALARAARLQGEASELLADLARLDAATVLRTTRIGDALDLAVYAGLPPPRGRNLLRHFIEWHGYRPPPMLRLVEMHRQLVEASPGRRIRIAIEHGELRTWRRLAYLAPRFVSRAAALR